MQVVCAFAFAFYEKGREKSVFINKCGNAEDGETMTVSRNRGGTGDATNCRFRFRFRLFLMNRIMELAVSGKSNVNQLDHPDF